MNNNNALSIPVASPQMGQLKTANLLLEGCEALKRAWEREGYWYFKDVLAKDMIGDMRTRWIDYLQRHGLINPGVDENRYNGADLTDMDIPPAELAQVSEVNQCNLHRMLTENPKIVAVMKELLGNDPFWLPIAEYRADPPGLDDSTQPHFIFPHQDDFYSPDMEMKICWIPVDYVDAELGGCALIEGAYRGPVLHDLSKPPLFPIPKDVVALDGWKRAGFDPGNIMIFDLNLSRSGLTNLSKDRFRMSMDIRVTEASGKVPSIANLLSLSEHQVIVANDQTGSSETFTIDARMYVRGTDGSKREGADISQTFHFGEKVIVNLKDSQFATLVRAIH